MLRTSVIDTADLDPASARRLENLVASADLSNLPEPTLSLHEDRDRFRYTLTVEEGDSKHSVTFDEHRVPETVQPLVDAVWHEGSRGPGTVTA